MENPAHWDEPTKVVSQALNTSHKRQEQMILGLSTAGQIVAALRDAGFCLEKHGGQ
jgi:hypothetical protein